MTKRRVSFVPALLLLSASLMAQTSAPRIRSLAIDPPDKVGRAIPLGHPDAHRVLHITVHLPFGDPVGAEQFARSVADPKSPYYRHFLTPEQVGSRFGLSSAQVEKVRAYLAAQGMKITEVGKSHLSVSADATVAQAETAFHTTLQAYASPDVSAPKEGLYSFTTQPGVPSEIAGMITHIGGLENFTQPKPMANTITPPMVRTLYNTAPIYNAGMHGEGRTIGISNFDGFRLSALPNLYSKFGLTAPAAGVGTNVTVRPINGGAGAGTQQGEGDLDIQSVLGVASCCNLVIYDGGGGDLLDTLKLEANDDIADVISESYGWQLTTSAINAAHSYHLQMNMQGQTYMAASGDNGTTLNYPYPDIDPEVLLVGGTTVSTDANGNRTAEVGWSGSGGGYVPSADAFNVLPAFQKGNGVPTNINSRLIPDVALNADPNSGYVIYLVAGVYEINQQLVPVTAGFYIIGGTSGASPTFAASLALSEQKLIALGALTGSNRLGRVQDLFYTYNGNSSVFFDVTSGTNGQLPNLATSNAGPGWDFVSGLGAMNFSGFVTAYAAAGSAVSSLTLSKTTVEGGSTTAVTGTVTVAQAAKTGGTKITLTSSNAAATVPASVTVAAGAKTATFAITTKAVSTGTNVTITAAGSTSTTATLTLTPPHATAASVSPSVVFGGGTTAVTGKVTIAEAAPAGGTVVNLASSLPTVASVPATVTVAAGATTASFTVTTVAVKTATPVTITVTAGGVNQTTTLTVDPLQLSAVALTPTAVLGTVSSAGTVTLNGPAPTGGAKVTLALSDATSATLSGTSVTVAAGATTAPFTIKTKAVNAAKSVTVTATYVAPATATLTINPPVISAITSNTTSNLGGFTSPTITFTLSGPAGPSGAVVTLSATPSTAASFSVTTLTIAAGKTSGAVMLKTSAVSANTTVTIKGTYNGSISTTLVVSEAAMSALKLSRTSVTGGSTVSVTGTITLTGAAGPSGDKVTLSSTNAAFPVPASVTVPAGAKTATFTVLSKKVTGSTSVTVTVTATLGVAKTAVISVTP